MKNLEFGKFLRKFVNVHFLQDLKNLAKIGRIWMANQDHQVESIAGPRGETRDQITVQELKLRPWQGPLASLPATLPKLTTQLTNLYGHGDDPTPDPHCTTSGTDPHPDPDQK